MKEIIVPENVLNAIVAYLQQKPFAEVAKLITALAQCKPKKEEEE